MKLLDIAFKDMLRSFRSFTAILFMFILPMLITGMFYLMFGRIAEDGEFSLPKTKVIVANMDKGGPKFNVDTDNVPGGEDAETMGELILGILRSDEMADLIEVTETDSPESARAAVDNQTQQVAIVIPPDFSDQFADIDGEASIEFYQDPTLVIGPGVIRAILNRFTEGMASVKIAVNVFIDEAEPEEAIYAGEVARRFLEISLAEEEDLEEELLEVRAPAAAEQSPEEKSENFLLRIIGPIMGGMMIFYAFYTGTFTAQSILREEEERTMQRLFATPTPQSVILGGKLLSVFMTVSTQVVTLLIAAHYIFGVEWGKTPSVAVAAAGIIISASSFGVFVNSLLKSTKQGGAIFGGVLTVTGMVGMVNTFGGNMPTAPKFGDVSLLTPQGWSLLGLSQAMKGEELESVLLTLSVLAAWSVIFFVVGVWRFNKRYS